MKTATAALALLGSASASASSSSGLFSASTTREEALAHVRAKFTQSRNGMVQNMASKGTRQAAAAAAAGGEVKSSATMSGNWMSGTVAADGASTCTGDGTPAETFIAKMNLCGLYEDSSGGSSYYAIWTCTYDTSSSSVSIMETKYSDSACTTGADAQPSYDFNGCSGGVLVDCTESNPFSSSVEDSYADGLSVTSFLTNSDCMTNTSALIVFDGLKGCYNGVLYGQDSAEIYMTQDCSGSALFSFGYDEVFPVTPGQCMAYTDIPDDDDDGDDDDDDFTDMILSREDSYLVLKYSSDSSDDDVCFHIDSKINYKGIEYTYEELKNGKEPECSVPHTPSSRGVVVSTSCGKSVRVTDTHLMATTKGYQLAYSLKAGDVLFGDHEGKELCTVQGVEKENATEQYFGLNCVHSEVLASGLRASTFGDFHTLPSWYMTYVGSVMGTETAAKFGEYVAEWYFQK